MVWFGSIAGPHERLLTGTSFVWFWLLGMAMRLPAPSDDCRFVLQDADAPNSQADCRHRQLMAVHAARE